MPNGWQAVIKPYFSQPAQCFYSEPFFLWARRFASNRRLVVGIGFCTEGSSPGVDADASGGASGAASVCGSVPLVLGRKSSAVASGAACG
jgi:hypothetical protein